MTDPIPQDLQDLYAMCDEWTKPVGLVRMDEIIREIGTPKNIKPLIERIARLEAELVQWKTWGIIEIAVRNTNVAFYVKGRLLNEHDLDYRNEATERE